MKEVKLQKYPAYKDTGVEWLGEIPEHWEVKKLKFLVIGKLKYGANESGVQYDSKLPRYVRITDFGQDGKLNEDKKLSLSWEKGCDYLLKDGDILFARSGATVGKTFQFNKSMSIEENYCYAGYLIKAEPNEKLILSNFLYIYTNSRIFDYWKDSVFIKATIENIGADKYAQLSVILPPIKEQIVIANFLDHKTAQIDSAIGIKLKQIELLNERRQILIHRAVTRGLNPDVKLKYSGVEWIGEIPEHWESVSFRRICTLQQGLQINIDKRLESLVEGSFEYITTKSIHNPEDYKQYVLNPKKSVICDFDDVLLGRTGNTGEVVTNVNGVFHNNFFKIAYDRKRVLKDFLTTYLNTNGIQKQIMLAAGVTTIPDINHGDFLDLPFIFPCLMEQKEIINYIKNISVKISTAISLKEKEIEKLKEYKSVLINEAVTGKIKVS